MFDNHVAEGHLVAGDRATFMEGADDSRRRVSGTTGPAAGPQELLLKQARDVLQAAEKAGLDPRMFYLQAVAARPPGWPECPPYEAVMSPDNSLNQPPKPVHPDATVSTSGFDPRARVAKAPSPPGAARTRGHCCSGCRR